MSGHFKMTLIVVAGLLAACAGQTGPTPTATEPSGSKAPDAVRAPAYIDEVELRVMESMPVQLGLHLVGSLPTPCHQLEWESDIPQGGGEIVVDVYSLAPADQACIQVLSPLDQTINLGQVQPGHYSVVVNGEQVGEFDA